MTPERWERVKDLFEAAVWRSPPARSEFLARACPDDEEVKREVESLLKAHDLDSGFMSTPVGTLLVDETALLQVGQHFGNYQQLAPIGKGGMGQVYSAIDTRLGRKIALKFLPSSWMHDTERVRRFEQEARAASALNHPNIVTIHEIGEVDSLQFIATEFIDGETLREHIREQSISIDEVLNIGSQICSALQAAHDSGIVHRDIKPENIMLRRDGIVKVLDFGLAKLAPEHLEVHSQAPPTSMVHTNAGVVMGTAGYMSPEQARAADVDERTDIWSLGVVMYEMLSGRAPFVGETPSHIFASILDHEPAPLSINSGVPDELQRIVSKCLVKNREQRYQKVRDLLVDLKRLKQQLEVDAAIGRTAERRKTRDDDVVTGIHKPVATDDIAVAWTGSRLVHLARRLKSKWMIAGTLAFVALITTVAYWRYNKAIIAPQKNQVTITDVRSVVVLPFEDQSQNPNPQHLPQSLSNELLQHKVIVTTHNAYVQTRGKALDVEEVANKVGAEAILTGRITQRGDNIVVSVELSDARDRSQIWREQYNHKQKDVLLTQMYTSRKIADRLREMGYGRVFIILRDYNESKSSQR